MSIDSGEEPATGSAARCRTGAMLTAVCPPNCTIEAGASPPSPASLPSRSRTDSPSSGSK